MTEFSGHVRATTNPIRQVLEKVETSPLNVLVDIVFESIEIHPKIIEIAEGCVFLLLIQFRSMFLLMDTDSLYFGGDIIDKWYVFRPLADCCRYRTSPRLLFDLWMP